MEPTSFCVRGCLGLAGRDAVAVAVEGSIGVLKGCEMSGVCEEVADGLLFAGWKLMSGGG